MRSIELCLCYIWYYAPINRVRMMIDHNTSVLLIIFLSPLRCTRMMESGTVCFVLYVISARRDRLAESFVIRPIKPTPRNSRHVNLTRRECFTGVRHSPCLHVSLWVTFAVYLPPPPPAGVLAVILGYKKVCYCWLHSAPRVKRETRILPIEGPVLPLG